jgi:membrane protein DedA with SNARE-associated domain
MATTGSVAGAFITYRLARKGGEKALERKFQARQVERIRKIFERWGFGALAVPAMLPPPMPLVPFLIAAGAMQYPAKKFLAAFTLGRLVRYSILAYLSARYGRAIIGFMGEHGHPVAFAIAGLALLMAFAAFLVWRGKKEGEGAAS